MPFVIVKFTTGVDKTWTIPDPMTFHDLLNRVEGYIHDERLPCGQAYRWANLWGKVGLLGLSPANKQHIVEYRQAVEAQVLAQTKFSMIPKDALDRTGQISVLLRTNLRSFKHEWLANALIDRSRGLRGGLRVTHVKTYTNKDYSRTGSCKDGWRLVLLQLSLIHI